VIADDSIFASMTHAPG